MPSPLNQPAPSTTVVASPAAAAETVIATSAGLIVDTPQFLVVVRASVDLTIGTNGIAVTFKLRRGTTASGTEITSNPVWGPYTVVATDEYQFSVAGTDAPGAVAGLKYSLTATVGSGSAPTTINVVYIEAFVSSLT